MKKNYVYALMSAIALTGAVGLTSCSESEDVVQNPNYNPETNEVLTNFVFNVSTGNTPSTRMSAANTQATIEQSFRGIDGAQLFAYKLVSSNSPDDGKHVTTATNADKTYSLGLIIPANQLDPDGSGTPPKSQRIIELSLPVATNTLMFWGKAPKTGDDANNAQGNILFNASSADISEHAFSLVPRVASGSDEATTLSHYQEVLTTLLNSVVQTRYQVDAEGLEWAISVGGDGSKNASALDIYWSDYVSVDGSSGAMTIKTNDPADASKSMSPLGEVLADEFVKLNTIYTNEARAGSGEAVHHMMDDLLLSIKNKVSNAPASSYLDYVAKQVSSKIINNINNFYNTQDGSVLGFDALLTNARSINAEINYNDVSGDLDAFPSNFGLPNGALQLSVTIDKTTGAHPVATWSYSANPIWASAGTTLSTETTQMNKYTYPAELCYFGNSPLRVSDDTHVAGDYPDGSDDWVTENNWADGWAKDSHVKSSTRSVAMQHNINYGTSLLKTTVGWAKEGESPTTVTVLYDNRATILQNRYNLTEENQSFTIGTDIGADNKNLQLTGILIGGQPQTVGWNYLAKTSSTFDQIIYDKALVSSSVPTTGDNYTLVWDNYNSTQEANAQGGVFVALEFVNNLGKDFWGENNVIRNGNTFYLVGKLYPSGTNKNTSTDLSWPTNYALPPYNSENGATIEAPRVFIQDYMTTANFAIGSTSLQHAYVTVPDLRSAQISLGLSVDLQWSTGMTFDNVILGQ